MTSITLTLTGDSSQLSAHYCPAIDLSDGEYVCGLIDFQTFNSIPNIDETNNLFYFGYANQNTEIKPVNIALNSVDLFESSASEKEEEGASRKRRRRRAVGNSAYNNHKKIPLTFIKIPTGSYELEQLAEYLQKRIKKKGSKLVLQPNKNTLRCELFCNQPIDFSRPNTVGPLLGFRSDQVLDAYEAHESQLPANILKVNVIRVECNIITGSYLNNRASHTIHEFSPRVPPGYKINEVPQNVIYFPITVKNIQKIELSLVDQNNQSINFRGETITIRLHIKKVKR